jgi:hypothetical protein
VAAHVMFYTSSDEVLRQAHEHQAAIRRMMNTQSRPSQRRERGGWLTSLAKLWNRVPIRVPDEAIWPNLREYPYCGSDPRYG